MRMPAGVFVRTEEYRAHLGEAMLRFNDAHHPVSVPQFFPDRNHSGVYRIRNTQDGKAYIGSSLWMRGRLKAHYRALVKGSHDNSRLQRAWDKWGEGAFICEEVELVDERETLIGREQYWLSMFMDTFGRDQLYNLKMEAGPGVCHDPETCALISAKKKGNVIVTAAQRTQISATLTGYKHSEETRAKVSAALIGNKYSLGVHPSAETRAKLSAVHKGRPSPKSPETRAKISATLQGRTISEEIRSRMKAGFTNEVRSRMSNSIWKTWERKRKEKEMEMLNTCGGDSVG